MKRRTLLVFFLLSLLLPVRAQNAGPLDGVWYDQRGKSLLITSEVVHANLTMRDSQGRSQVVRARYAGYTHLEFPTGQGRWGYVLMLDSSRIRVVGGGWDGDYTR